MSRTVVVATGAQVVWGAEISLLTIGGLLRDRVPLRLLCSNPQLAQRWREAGLGPVALRRARAGRISRLVSFAGPLWRGLPRHSTLLVFDFYLLPLVVALLPVLRLKDVRVVVDLHDSSRRNPRRAPYFRLLRFADAVVCISDYLAAQVPPGPAVHVVPRPVDAPPAARSGDSGGRASDDELHVGIVGQITPDKGVGEVVDWFRGVPDGAVLHVRGAAAAHDGGYAESTLERAAATLGRRFVYDGLVERDAAMSGLDLLVVANADEPFGRTVVEAQLAGVVPLVPDAGGSRELVDPPRSGLVYRAGDGASFLAQLAAFQADPALRDRLRRSGRTHAAALADPVRIRDDYAAALGGEAA